MAKTPPQSVQTLDLRTTKCPLNFVQTRLALEKLKPGEVLEIWILAEAESAINIPISITQEGHQVIYTDTSENTLQKLWIARGE